MRLDDELEALYQDIEYLLSDQEKMEVRILLLQNWEAFKTGSTKLGRTSLVEQDIIPPQNTQSNKKPDRFQSIKRKRGRHK